MPTVYHKDQAGAPSYGFSTGPSNVAHFNALKTILKACLVTGYGSLPAAGWELIAEGDLYLALRNGSHSGYVCFSRPSASAAGFEVWLAETFTGVVNNRMTGVGLKSGSASLNAQPQTPSNGYLAYSATRSGWYLIADEKSFYFQGGGESTTYPVGNNENDRVPLYVGEDSAGNFISVGGRNLASASLSGGRFDQAGFTALRSPATGLLVDSASITLEMPALMTAGSTNNRFSGLLPEVSMGRIAWYGDGVLGGFLRGLAIPAELSTVFFGDVATALGFSGAIGPATLNTPLDLGDGNTWFITVQYYFTPNRLATDAAGYW